MSHSYQESHLLMKMRMKAKATFYFSGLKSCYSIYGKQLGLTVKVFIPGDLIVLLLRIYSEIIQNMKSYNYEDIYINDLKNRGKICITTIIPKIKEIIMKISLQIVYCTGNKNYSS